MAANLKELWTMISSSASLWLKSQCGLEIVCTVEAKWGSRVGMEKLKDLMKDYDVKDNQRDDSDVILQEIREQLGVEECHTQEVPLEDDNDIDIEMVDDE